MGSEGQGIGPAIRRRLDLTVRIPMRGRIGSLNAAVAGSVLLFEAAAQRDPTGPTRRPRAVARDSDAPGRDRWTGCVAATTASEASRTRGRPRSRRR